jgi:hypothetical protein
MLKLDNRLASSLSERMDFYPAYISGFHKLQSLVNDHYLKSRT